MIPLPEEMVSNSILIIQLKIHLLIDPASNLLIQL